MSELENGKLTTFFRLLQDEPVIIIPKVQRDYVYGRNDQKIHQLLHDMLRSMLDAVRQEKPVVLDFVYSASYVNNDDCSEGLIPLDGQQRLTTLFLLYFYAGVVQPDVADEEVAFLNRFRYETRQTATDFCNELLNDTRTLLIKHYTSNNSIVRLIEDSPKFRPDYKADPTITSMLNVLDEIERQYREQPIEDLWAKLTTNDYIQFYALSLEHFHLTDELYIKMNARGKPLTVFEIFKSDLEQTVGYVSEDTRYRLAKRIDTKWMDVVWTYVYDKDNPDKSPDKADRGYMNLFRNIFRMLLFRHRIEIKSNRPARIDEMTSDETIINEWMAIFDTIVQIHSKGIAEQWYQYFYFSNDIVGQPGKIRLFWQQEQNRKPILHLAIDRELSAPELVYLYAIIELEHQQKTVDVVRNSLRVIRNLVTANTRANSARYDMLSGFFDDVQEVIDNDGCLLRGMHTFVSTACEEEITKNEMSAVGLYPKLLRYENHAYLQASLRLFYNHYNRDGLSPDILLKKLSHFESLFDNNSVNNFEKLRCNLLQPDSDYRQYEKWMNSSGKMIRRYMIHRPSDWTEFLIDNVNRMNQGGILEAIDSILNLENKDAIASRFSVTSWQYYMAKYASAGRSDTAYGIYAWDDEVNRPLEAVILNSSQHSPNNIEWLMLNHILYSELANKDKYELDYHASSPVVLKNLGVKITIKQEGWGISTDNVAMVERLMDTCYYHIEADYENNTYTLWYDSDKCNGDYIDMAKQLIQYLETL